MKTKFFRWSLLPALALALFAACSEQGTPADQLMGPSETAALSKSPKQDMWNIARGLPIERSVYNSAVIGPEGGFLYVDLHYLYVPRGAVAAPTLFEINVDPTGAVGADLQATSVNPAGKPIGNRNNVGRAGFRTPVYLTFSYAEAQNVPTANRLKVLWARPDGTLDPQPTHVFERYKTATGVLRHFSIYTLGWGGE